MKTGIEIVKNLMDTEKVSNIELGRRVGLTKQAMYSLLKQDDIKTKRFLELLAHLGYQISIRKVKYARITEETMELIENTKKPIGVFFCEKGGKYIAVDNRGATSVTEFDSECKCMEYLDTICE